MTTVERPAAAEATRGRPRRGRISPYWLTVAIAPLLLLGWHLVTTTRLVPAILLPSPGAVLRAAPRVIGADGFGGHVARTLGEIAGGFVLGAAVGFGLGLLLGSSARLRAAYLPLLSALEAVPTVILAPLIIAWFGFGIDGKIVQAAIACFYAVFITTLSGLALADPASTNLLRSLRASKWQEMRLLRIPTALPVIFGGLQLGATTAIIGAIVSEFVAADRGLGYLMLRYRSSFNTASAWVIIFAFLLIGVVTYLLLWSIERRVVFWRAHATPDTDRRTPR